MIPPALALWLSEQLAALPLWAWAVALCLALVVLVGGHARIGVAWVVGLLLVSCWMLSGAELADEDDERRREDDERRREDDWAP